MSEPKDKIEQTLEVLLYAPIGVGMYLKEMGPTFVARGRAEVDRRHAQMQQRTTTARSIGQVAVGFGVPKVRERMEREVDSARQRAQSFLGVIGGVSLGDPEPVVRSVPTPPEPFVQAPVAAPATSGAANGATNGTAPAGDTLPIPGYDALSASQVVERLAGLTPEELESVRAYESAHRNRRTILGKIDQISA
jgi:hypothetical protein